MKSFKVANTSSRSLFPVQTLGRPRPCSKYEFGIQLAEEFGVDHMQIYIGMIAYHSIEVPQVKNLILNTERLPDFGITTPNYETFIKKIKEN